MNVGFRVYKAHPQPDADALRRLSEGSVCNIADAMHWALVMDGGIHQIYSPMRKICGAAITVDVWPGDGLMVRAAIDLAKDGDVLVVNSHGCVDRSMLGGTICMHAANHGISGIVVDGAVRDVHEIRALDFPVMARALTPRSGTTEAGWGEINVPVACGGVAVMPGDVVVGDSDGLVVVPGAYVESVAERLEAAEAKAGRPDQLDERREKSREKLMPGLEQARRAIKDRQATVSEGSFVWWDSEVASR